MSKSKAMQSLLEQISVEGQPLLTRDQISALLKIKVNDELLFDDLYFTYEVINMIKRFGYDATIEYIKDALDQDLSAFGIESIRKYVIRESPALEKVYDKVLINLEIYKAKPEIQTGGVDCPRCKSQRTLNSKSQRRSADEPMTITASCLDCGLNFTVQ